MKMLRQCYIYNVSKQISERITSYNKLYYTIARTFYNDEKAVSFLSQDLLKRQGIDKLKIGMNKKCVILPPSRSRTKGFIFSTEAPRVHDFITFNLKEWWAQKKKEYRLFAQKKYYERYLMLGTDLATAYFVVKYGGRVKLKGHSDWIESLKKGDISQLPTDYDPDFILEAVDLRGYPIEFDNLNNILNLHHLKWLSLRGCETINDWALDKLSTRYPTLEYFDISECINVSERGLEALYRMPNLKKLVVTNYYNSVALELTCFMLEDINPCLRCEILKPEKKLLSEE